MQIYLDICGNQESLAQLIVLERPASLEITRPEKLSSAHWQSKLITGQGWALWSPLNELAEYEHHVRSSPLLHQRDLDRVVNHLLASPRMTQLIGQSQYRLPLPFSSFFHDPIQPTKKHTWHLFLSWTFIQFSRMSLSFSLISYFYLTFNLSLILNKACYSAASSHKCQHLYSSLSWENKHSTVSRLIFGNSECGILRSLDNEQLEPERLKLYSEDPWHCYLSQCIWREKSFVLSQIFTFI